ncbi:MAG: hypothetical protein ACRDF4_08430, partial [Rhabdochlamydiaceae bacterium]
NYSYYAQDLTVLDWTEFPIWDDGGLYGALTTPQYSFTTVYSVNIQGYVFKDNLTYTNGFFGVGESYKRTMTTTVPNGSIYTTDITNYYLDPVRFIVYNEGTSYYWLWTVTPQSSDNIEITSGSALWTLPLTTNLIANVSLSQVSSNLQIVRFRINQTALVSQGADSAIALSTNANPNASQGLASAIFQAFLNPLAWVGGQIQGFARWLFTTALRTFLQDLGLGWIISAIEYFIAAILLLLAIVEATLPYLGVILLLVNLYYLITFNFEGLFTFWIQVYGVVAQLGNALIDFAVLIHDFISSITGAGAVAAAA